MEILPEYSEKVFCFQYKRTNSIEPAQDLKHLMDDLGTEWWKKKEQLGSRSSASESLLNTANFLKEKESLSMYIKSETNETAVSFGTHSTMKSFKLFDITPQDLRVSNGLTQLKTIYRQKAFDAHPDKGGSNTAFIRERVRNFV